MAKITHIICGEVGDPGFEPRPLHKLSLVVGVCKSIIQTEPNQIIWFSSVQRTVFTKTVFIHKTGPVWFEAGS